MTKIEIGSYWHLRRWDDNIHGLVVVISEDEYYERYTEERWATYREEYSSLYKNTKNLFLDSEPIVHYVHWSNRDNDLLPPDAAPVWAFLHEEAGFFRIPNEDLELHILSLQ